jgi:hypothetical protein
VLHKQEDSMSRDSLQIINRVLHKHNSHSTNSRLMRSKIIQINQSQDAK